MTVFFLAALPFAKEEKVSFDAQAAWGYVKILASDSMEGRKSGQPGAAKAEEYIAAKFKEWGLKPAGDNGTYFQNFTMEHRHVEEGVTLEIITDRARRNFDYEEDWRVEGYSGSGHFTTEVVFVGYGIHAPEEGYDDYAEVNAKGKLVLFSSDTPSGLKDRLEDEAAVHNRIKAAQELGARGILSYSADRERGRYSRLMLRKTIYRPDFVILSVEKNVTDFIFKELPTEASYLVRKTDRTFKPVSFHTGVKAFVSVNSLFDEARPSRNVLAKITGSDKDLNEECLVIGAHMDHLGIYPLGEVMNGANDNASGTAVVMEIARVMRQNRMKLERTVLFGLWAGEEQGLWGSRHYVDDPPISIDKTIAYINLDMVGYGGSKVPFEGIYFGPEIWQVLKEKIPPKILEYVVPGRGGPRGSDHASFLRKGVPGFFITQPPLLKYHHNRDDSDLIEPELLKKTGEFVLEAIKILASEPRGFIQPMREETFHLKVQKLINYRFSLLDRFIEHHKEAKDSDVDLQLSLVEQGDLEGDDLRIGILKNIISSSEEIKRVPGLTFYSSSGRLSRDIYQGKTTLLPGLKGIHSLSDDPKWAQVLSKQGIFFVLIDDSSLLFEEENLSKEGERILKALNANGLLVLAKDLNFSRAKTLLEAARKPMIVLSKELPDKEIVALIKKTKSALGLILSQDDLPAAYFERLHEAKSSLGTDHLLIVNEPCLWEDEGRAQMLNVISEILKAHYQSSEVSDLFSETFLRILREVRGEEQPTPFAYIPF